MHNEVIAIAILEKVMNEKYRILNGPNDEVRISPEGKPLYRIQALRKVYDHVVEGSIGGWLEHEGNLDTNGFSWINAESCVYGNARLCQGAILRNGASKIRGDSIVIGRGYLFIDECLIENSRIVCGQGFPPSLVISNSKIFNSLIISYGPDDMSISNSDLNNVKLVGRSIRIAHTLRNVKVASNNCLGLKEVQKKRRKEKSMLEIVEATGKTATHNYKAAVIRFDEERDRVDEAIERRTMGSILRDMGEIFKPECTAIDLNF